MKKIIKLKESDLQRIVKKVIVSEQRNIIVKDGLTIDDIIENGDSSEIMYIGSRGDGVKEIQEILSNLNYDLGGYGSNHDGIDSKFGHKTKNAVIEFQEDEDIEDDGIVGIETANSFREVGEEIEDEEIEDEEIEDEEIEDEEIEDEVVNGDIRYPSESSSASPPLVNRWGKPHHGYDINADRKIFRKNGNVPLVVCNNPGTVTHAGKCGTYGNLVEIKHGNNDYSSYGHLYSVDVSEGETVNVGDVIGVEGSTGKSTGNHVHFEFRVIRPNGLHNRCGEGSPDVEVNGFSNIRPLSDVDKYYYYQVGDNSYS